MNNILTNEAKKAIRCPKNYMNERFWKENEDGGMGLLNMEVVNDKTLLSTFMNQGINHEAEFPKKCIVHQIREKGFTVNTLKDMNTDKDKSYIAGIAMVLKKMHIQYRAQGHQNDKQSRNRYQQGKILHPL
jgi:hypothetical protein